MPEVALRCGMVPEGEQRGDVAVGHAARRRRPCRRRRRRARPWSTCGSRRKATAPAPPSPPRRLTIASSTNSAMRPATAAPLRRRRGTAARRGGATRPRGRTSTSLRPARLPNFTLPSAVANSVSSPPRPTLSPGWNFVPRWRTMIEPAVTARAVEDLHAEPLGVGVATVAGGGGTLLLRHGVRPFVTLGDPGDLDRRVVLAVAPAAAVVRLVLVGEPVDLRALGLADDPGRSPRRRAAGPGVDSTSSPSTTRTGCERRPRLAGRAARRRAAGPRLDPVLLAAGLDHCVHGAPHPAEAELGRSGC